MNLSRKWLTEFVDLPLAEIDDRSFAEAMTVSGSKVEVTEDLSARLKNVVVGRVLTMEKHPDSDHMWVLSLDVGQAAPVQIVTGAWNVHEGDLVPVALDGALLPTGAEIRSGSLRGVRSDGMLCSLKELDLTTHDYAYAAIRAAAVLGDYHPLDKSKPSISPDIAAGDKIFGAVKAAEVTRLRRTETGDGWDLVLDLGAESVKAVTPCANVHLGDLVAYDTKLGKVCELSDLRAEQKEFPHCIEDGIFILREDVQPGDDIAALTGNDDHVVEFEITPNRPDCLSMIGLARESAVSFERPLALHAPEYTTDGGSVDDYIKVAIDAPDLCYRYTAAVVRNVKIAPSPLWLRRRLRAAGVRAINNSVDITNYVMLEYGQPMHAFDYVCLEGKQINVRRAADGEKYVTLDNIEHTLDSTMLVIADGKKPVALAGVMGGANSGISDTTSTVVFESAMFNGASVRVTSRKNGMRTESSGRFEKGLDAENTLPALRRALELVKMLGAGEVVDGMIDVYPTKREIPEIPFEPDVINRFLGTDIPEDFMRATFKALDFKVNDATVVPPSYRADVLCMNDLAEEVIRVWGYGTLGETLSSSGATEGGRTHAQQYRAVIEDTLCGMGLDQIETFSFISPKFYDKIKLAPERRKSVTIRNPLGEDTSVMRTTAIPSMLGVLSYN